ncbi:MAG: zinc ribbon domain-containing protein [Nitrospirota bacterium]|nr:zinc ribbon domain-containing protein [Nitrospirota bacterium]
MTRPSLPALGEGASPKESAMPVYEYRCEQCTHQFEATQSIHARPEDTVCPQCSGVGASRVLSACATKVKGTHKPGFEEMKAYNMLHERMDRFSKLPPAMGKRVDVTSDMMSGDGTSPTEGNGA